MAKTGVPWTFIHTRSKYETKSAIQSGSWCFAARYSSSPAKLALAATRTSKTCSQQDVQAAIDAAQDGDTVVVPAGTSKYKIITPGAAALKIKDKGIALIGAGIGRTILKDHSFDSNNPWAGGPIRAEGGAGKALRISGFTFDGTGIRDSGKPAIINIRGSYADLRIDHCRFLNVNGAIMTDGLMRGVVDHCRYELMEDHALGNPFFCLMTGNGAAAWKNPVRLGSANAIYIEDCHIEFHNPKSNDSPALPTMDGARAVFRHNTVHDGFLEFFGVNSTPRGTASFEVYDNTFTGNCFCAMGFKGGTGVVFNNTINGEFQRQPIWATEYRTGGPRQQCGQCDGTSRFDGNSPLNGDKQAYTGLYGGTTAPTSWHVAGKRWKPNGLVGYAVWNEADHSVGKITREYGEHDHSGAQGREEKPLECGRCLQSHQRLSGYGPDRPQPRCRRRHGAAPILGTCLCMEQQVQW